MPGLSSINYNGANRTDRGTKIVKPGEEMDKNEIGRASCRERVCLYV